MAYRDVILSDSPRYFWRCDGNWASSANGPMVDIAGSVAYNVSGAGFSSVAGLIAASGDSNDAFQSTSNGQHVNIAGAGSQTGNNVWSLDLWLQFSANPSGNTALFGIGGTSSGQSVNVTITTAGHLQIDTNTTSLVSTSGALSTGTPHYVGVTWDGTTISLYVDSLTATNTATPGALSLTSNQIAFCCDVSGNRSVSGITAIVDEIAYYPSTLSLARVQAHYLAGRKPYGAGDYYKQQILAALVRNTSLTAIGTTYLALYSAEPGDADASGTELSGNGYARVSITSGTSAWSAPANSGTNTPYSTQNNNIETFPTATADWLYAGWYSLEDAASASHRIMWGQLTAPVKVVNGQAGQFSANNITVSEA